MCKKQLSLTLFYRCPKKRVIIAKVLVPDIESIANAGSGEVKIDPDYFHIANGDLVLSRMVKPLVILASGFVKSGR